MIALAKQTRMNHIKEREEHIQLMKWLQKQREETDRFIAEIRQEDIQCKRVQQQFDHVRRTWSCQRQSRLLDHGASHINNTYSVLSHSPTSASQHTNKSHMTAPQQSSWLFVTRVLSHHDPTSATMTPDAAVDPSALDLLLM
jgi:hypothetical protein